MEAAHMAVVYFVMEQEPKNVTTVMVEGENTTSWGEDTKNVSIAQAEALIAVSIAREEAIINAFNAEAMVLSIAMPVMEQEWQQ